MLANIQCSMRNGVECETPLACEPGCLWKNDPVHPNRTTAKLLDIPKDWCMTMAAKEGDAEIGAGGFVLSGYFEGAIIARTLFTARAAGFSPRPHWDQEPNPLRAECIDDARDVMTALAKAGHQHAPGLLEEGAQWMISRGYATGPGDTISDLMAELAEQAREHAHRECIMLAELYASKADLHRDLRPETIALVIRDAIRALKVKK